MKINLVNIPEMKKKYNNEWVLIADPVYDKANKIKKGRVIFHSEDRERIDKAMLEAGENNIAIKYLGAIDKDLSVIL